MTELTKKHCVACSGDTPPLKAEEVERLHQQIPDWDVTSGRKLVRPGLGARERSAGQASPRPGGP